MDYITWNAYKSRGKSPKIRDYMRYAKHYRAHMNAYNRAVRLNKSLKWT